MSSPGGSPEIGTSSFTKAVNIPIEELSGLDRQKAQAALDYLHQSALTDGWRPIAGGPHWYSRRYERRWSGATYSSGLAAPDTGGTPSSRSLGSYGCFTVFLMWITGIAVGVILDFGMHVPEKTALWIAMASWVVVLVVGFARCPEIGKPWE